MNAWKFTKNQPSLRRVVSDLLGIGKIKQLGVLFLFLLFICTSGYALAAVQPGAQRLVNPDFEQGTMNGWTGQGNGQWGVEQCCGQHETPFWGRNGNPYPVPAYTSNTWNGFVAPVPSGSTQLYQWSQVTLGQRYRLSAWVYTGGATAYLHRWSASLGSLVECASTANTAHTPLACEFTANATESMAFILELGYVSGQKAVVDDWTLTPIITVPRDWLADTWSTLPVPYYIDSSAYVMRTDIAAWSWNNAMGRQMLVRTSNANQPNSIRVSGVYEHTWPEAWFGDATLRKDENGVKYIRMNKWWMDRWHSNNYRFGFEAREMVIAHEFGHSFGLEHVQNECQLMNAKGLTIFNCLAFKPTSGDVNGMRAIYP